MEVRRRLLDVLRLTSNSRHCRIATAFCTRMLNQLMRPFESFLDRGGRLQILTLVMNNFNNPDDLVHLRRQLGNCEVRVFYPGKATRRTVRPTSRRRST